MKIGVVLAVLVVSFMFAAFSLSRNAVAANLSPTPTLTPTLVSTPAATSNSTVSCEQTSSVNGTTVEFGYASVGQERGYLPTPNTFTLCNYVTPPHAGVIVDVSIYLEGVSEGSQVSAVVFANVPKASFPQGAEPIAQSSETVNVSSVSGQWYNFAMNYSASSNTVYWLGYYSDNVTHYFFDNSSDTITVTSQQENGTSSSLPVVWYYQGKAIMSLYAVYTLANSSQPQPTVTPIRVDSAVHESTLSCGDTLFVLSIMGAETAVVVTHQVRRRAIAEGDKKS